MRVSNREQKNVKNPKFNKNTQCLKAKEKRTCESGDAIDGTVEASDREPTEPLGPTRQSSETRIHVSVR